MAMSIEKLKREHSNMLTVLELAEMELAQLNREPDADQTLLRRALDYLRHYFDQIHHPHEDVMFAYVDARRCEAHETVMSHAAGHEAIYRLGDILDDWLDNPMLEGQPLPADFGAICHRYLRLQRESLDTEETVVFPAADHCLSRSDWRAIDANSRVKGLPAGDAQNNVRFGALYQVLTGAS